MKGNKKINELGKQIPCEIYSRVCGFYRPVKQFNKGKKEEFKKRKEYIISESLIEKLMV